MGFRKKKETIFKYFLKSRPSLCKKLFSLCASTEIMV